MPNYPTIPSAFPTRVDGETFFAAHMNAVQEEIQQISGALLLGMPHDLFPALDATYDLGSAGRRWNEIWVVKLEIEDAHIHGDLIVDGAVSLGRLPYLDLAEQIPPAPGDPAAATARLHALDVNGFTALEVRDANANVVRLASDNVLVGKVSVAGGIARGQVVFISGATGANPLLGLARANALATMPTVGLALDPGANNAFIRVLMGGTIQLLNTAGFAEGAALFVSPTVAGDLTSVLPAPPAFRQRVGFVTRSHATQGEIVVVTTGTDIPLPGNLAYVDVANPWSVGQAFPTVGIPAAAPYGFLNINVNDNDAGMSFHYPGVMAYQIGRRGLGLSIGIMNTGGPTMGNDRLSIHAAGVRIGNALPPKKLLHVGAGDAAPQNSYEGILAQDPAAVQISARNTGENVEVGMFAHSAALGAFMGTWTPHPLVIRTGNTDRITVSPTGVVTINGNVVLGGSITGTDFTDWADVPFASVTFATTGGGTWNVIAGNMSRYRWKKMGKVVFVSVAVTGTSTTGSPGGGLTMTMPPGVTLAGGDAFDGLALVTENGFASRGLGFAIGRVGPNRIEFQKADGSAWVTGGNIGVIGGFWAEVG